MSLKVSEYPKMVPFCVEEGSCNLACPKCPVHGDHPLHDKIQGKMPFDQAVKLFDELEGKDLTVTPSGVTEPLIQKNFFEYVSELNKRNIKITMNSNGFLINEKMANKLVNDYEIASIFISIDAMSSETLLKTRATKKIEKVNQAVFNLLEARGDKSSPRIGVSFTKEPANLHEEKAFIDYWIQHVDAVRVNELYILDGGEGIQENRPPCPVLYDTLFIGPNGNARLCCLDVFDDTSVGNVLKTSVKDVWHGEKLNQIRKFHEAGEFHKVDFCKNCKDWPRYDFAKEYEENNILIRKSKLLTYYNRMDRLDSWKNR